MNNRSTSTRRWTLCAALWVAAALAAPGARAAVTLPSLGIQTLLGDTAVQQSGATFSVDATAFELVLTPGNPLDIADVPLILSAGKLTGAGPIYTSGAGTLQVGSLLSATFSSLTVMKSGSSALFHAILQYTGGSLSTGLTSGRIEGTMSGFDVAGLGGDFVATQFIAQVGQVTPVPLPAAAWMFAGALAALPRRRAPAA